MPQNKKRMLRLLSAQQKAHSIAAASAARARIALAEAEADQERMLHNGGGGNDIVPAAVVLALGDPARRAQRLAEIAGHAEELRDVANRERRLARQLERLIDRRRAAEAVASESRLLNEQLDSLTGRLMSSTTQVPSDKV